MKKILTLASVFALVLGLGLAACDGGSDDDKKNNNNPGTDTVEQPGADVEAPGEDVVDPICTPACDGKLCGDDGCGGSCGSCPPGVICMDGQCPCEADCAGKECGPDSCGGYCGSGDAETQGCAAGDVCANGMCEPPCVPNCDGKECGSDGCDGSCGTCPCDGCDPEAIECTDGMCTKPDECDCQCIFDCFETCPQGDQACYQNCVNSATIEAQMAYNNLITCLDQSGYFNCAEGDDACLEETFEACMDQYYDCFAGDMECVDMYLCIIDCPPGDAGQVCAQECFGEGSKDALLTWDAFIGCIDTEGYFDCADGDDACLQAAWDACNTEFTACAHGDMSCSEMFDCLDTCAPTDQICGLSCIVHGTVDAQGQWDAMVDCIVEQCGEQTDPECENTALEGACSGVYNACIGS
jgi:hypothetical protein